MIVDYAPNQGLSLVEAEDLKGFKFRLRGTTETRPAIAGITFADDDHVFIGVDTVKSLPGAPDSPEWLGGFQKMIDYAATKGWIDPSTNAIRAHVERAS